MKFFVRKKEYDAVKGALDACERALNREHEKCKIMTQDYNMIAKEKKEERHRAEHFQARCEAYEDAAHNAGFVFVGTPRGFVLERRTADQHQATFWERMRSWP